MYNMSGTFTHIVSLGISLKRGLRRAIEEFRENKTVTAYLEGRGSHDHRLLDTNSLYRLA